MDGLRLLVTDLDGTLIGGHPPPGSYLVLQEKINDLRRQHNAQWAVISGRSKSLIQQLPLMMQGVDARPDFILVNHGQVFSQSSKGCVYNAALSMQLARLRKSDAVKARKAFKEVIKEVPRMFPRSRYVTRESGGIMFQFSDPMEVEQAYQCVSAILGSVYSLRIIRLKHELEVWKVDFEKGLAIKGLQQYLQIHESETCCIGNSSSDVSMLVESVCATACCPANADQDLKDFLQSRGGYISHAQHVEGVCECLEGLKEESLTAAPVDVGIRKNGVWLRNIHRPERGGVLKPAVVAASSVYLILLVLAYFDLLPFSRLIRWPVDLVIGAVVKLTDLVR
jgi:hydroxymethylpyrimidine pyrophosphatase-like HAD family hydrolase